MLRALAISLAVALPCVAQARFPVQIDGRWGFVDRSGRVVVEAVYDSVSTFADGLARVELGADRSRGSVDHSSARHGFLDVNGELRIPARFEHARGFSEGLAAVRVERRYGYVDTAGKLVIPTRFPGRVGDFHEGRAYVELDASTLGYLDRSGKVVFRVRGVDVGDPGNFSGGLVRVTTANERVRFYRPDGELAFAPEVEFAGPFTDGLARARTDKGWGYLDTKGEWALPPSFDYAGRFAAPFGIVSKDRQAFYVDRDGKQPFACDGFDRLGAFHEGLACVRNKQNGKYGYIDRTGEWVIEPRWDDPFGYAYFRDGLARVADQARGSKWRGWIDRTGKLVWSTPTGK